MDMFKFDYTYDKTRNVCKYPAKSSYVNEGSDQIFGISSPIKNLSMHDLSI